MDPFSEHDPGDGSHQKRTQTNNGQQDSGFGRLVSIARDKEVDLEFDPEELKVEDLRIECQLRGIPKSGPKSVVIKKLRQAIQENKSLPLHRLSAPVEKPKKAVNKREPQRSDFSTDEEFDEQWKLWRQQRDHNNESVKKSREAAKRRKEEHERLCREREEENKKLATDVCKMKKEVMFLVNMLKEPGKTTAEESARIDKLMARIATLPKIPYPSSESAASLSAQGLAPANKKASQQQPPQQSHKRPHTQEQEQQQQQPSHGAQNVSAYPPPGSHRNGTRMHATAGGHGGQQRLNGQAAWQQQRPMASSNPHGDLNGDESLMNIRVAVPLASTSATARSGGEQVAKSAKRG